MAGCTALAVAVLALLPRSPDQAVRTTPPAEAPPGPIAPPGHRSPKDLPRVASIEVAGEQWFLLAGYDARGGFCFGEATEAMGSFGCGVPMPLRPGEVVTAAPVQDMRTHRPGETLPRHGYGRRPPGQPLHGGAAAGADVEAVVALGPDGREIGRLTSPFWWEMLPPPCDPPAPPDSGP